MLHRADRVGKSFAWMIALFGLVPLLGQHPHWAYVEPGPKAPQDRISSIYKGSYGFMWFGTDLGLYRFDGYSSRLYSHDPSDADTIPAGRVRAIHEDDTGRFWVGTTSGLALLDRQTGSFQRFHRDADNNVRALASDQGRLWVGTDQGLQVIDQEQAHKLAFSANVAALGFDATGRLWVGTERGLWFQEGEHFVSVVETQRMPISSLAVAPDGIWAGGPSGLVFLDRAGEMRCWQDGELAFVSSVAWHARHGVMVGTRKGLQVQGAMGFVLHAAEKEPNRVMGLYLDHTDLLWVARGQGGVSKLDLRADQFGFFDLASRDGAMAMAIAPGQSQKIWVGTREGLGLLDLDGGVNHWYFPRLTIRCIAPVSDGRLILGTERRLLRFDPNNPTLLEELQEGARFWRVLQERDERIWVATSRGLGFHDLQSGEQFTVEAGDDRATQLSHRLVSALLKVDDQLLVGTFGGGLNLRDLNTGEMARYSNDPEDPSSLSANDLTHLLEDREKRVWVATISGGLNLFQREQGRFVRLSEREGFPSNAVVAMAEDHRGDLWVSTGIGLIHLNTSNFRSTIYRDGDGAGLGGGLPGAVLPFDDGSIFFGGTAGVLRLHPDRMLPLLPVPVVFTGLRSDNTEQHLLTSGSRLILPYDHKVLTLAVAVLDFRAPDSCVIEYERQDLDDGWVHTDDGMTEVNYTRYLNYGGEGVLAVRGWDHQGQEREARINIEVLPPPWLKWVPFMVVAAILLLILLIYLGISYRERRKRRALVAQARLAEQRRELAEQRALVAEQRNEVEKAERRLQEERTVILQEHLEQVSSEIAGDLHDGPLASLNGLGFHLRGVAGQAEDGLRGDLLKISDQVLPKLCTDLRNVCGQLLTPDFRYGLVTELETFADVISNSYPQLEVIQSYLVDPVPLSREGQAGLYRIFRTLLKNVGQHARAQHVWIELAEGDGAVCLSIKDDGQGFVVPETWDAFRREKHYGMYMANYFSESLGGVMRVVSSPGSGTHTLVEIPRKHDDV